MPAKKVSFLLTLLLTLFNTFETSKKAISRAKAGLSNIQTQKELDNYSMQNDFVFVLFYTKSFKKLKSVSNYLYSIQDQKFFFSNQVLNILNLTHLITESLIP